MLDVGRHPNIELMAYSEVEGVKGKAGNFTVIVRRKARYVEEGRCTGCGACTEKCPETVLDTFNLGLGERTAIYSWFAQGIPSTHTIDPQHCRQLQGRKCGICKKTCQADAVDFDQKDQVQSLKVGAIIIASGYDVFDPTQIPEYRYAQIPNVVTALEFERLLSASGPTRGHLYRPSDLADKARIESLEKQADKSLKVLKRFEEKYGENSEEFFKKHGTDKFKEEDERKKWADRYGEYLDLAESLEELRERVQEIGAARRLAFVQCVGSRDLRFYPFCSEYCCMHSIKEAIIAHEHEPQTRSTIFGMDIRAVGKGFEEYKIRGGEQAAITYVRGRVAEIKEGPDHHPVLTYEDTLQRMVKSEEFDMVVLATACVPSKGTRALADILGIECNAFGFFKTDSSQPMDTTREGIFVCGCAHGPMDIPESVAQASGAAARAAQVLLKPQRRKAS